MGYIGVCARTQRHPVSAGPGNLISAGFGSAKREANLLGERNRIELGSARLRSENERERELVRERM